MQEQTFFFYDLETSGRDFRRHRIMQFAGQRTDMDLNPIGEPMNIRVKLSPEVIPEAMATIITGITPQYVNEHGITESEAIKQIMEEAFTPGTIAIGFNNIRFDDEYIRFTAFRNFHDAYSWTWKDDRSRWDLLDAIRLIRALRPEGIEWPVDEAGEPTNKLELLAKANGLMPVQSHDAMSDVNSTIAIAQLLKEKQPKMFEYLFNGRNKEAVMKVADPVNPEPFIYASGRYGKEHGFVTIGYPLALGEHKKTIIYNLLLDPTLYDGLSPEQLAEKRATPWEDKQVEGFVHFPAKFLAANKCPAVAPYVCLRDEDCERLGFDKEVIAANLAKLLEGDLPTRLTESFKLAPSYPPAEDVDGSLYDGFINAYQDKNLMAKIVHSTTNELAGLHPQFEDQRLNELFTRYKGRNFPELLTPEESDEWLEYARHRKAEDKEIFEKCLPELGELDEEQKKLMTDLKEWADTAI
jgi:exodeoxyribonuclease-1